MVNYGGAFPYMARVGKQPHMLPSLNGPPRDDQAGPGRHSHRLREVSLQKIIEEIAIARINRALDSSVTPAGEQLDYKIGELVDFWRVPAEKDASGWQGPAKTTAVHNDRGLVEVVYRREVPMRVNFGDIRRFMDFAALCYSTSNHDVVYIIERFIRNSVACKVVTFGYHLVG